MALGVSSYGYCFSNWYDNDHGYGSPSPLLWLYIGSATAMIMTMASTVAIAIGRHGDCTTWNLHSICRRIQELNMIIPFYRLA